MNRTFVSMCLAACLGLFLCCPKAHAQPDYDLVEKCWSNPPTQVRCNGVLVSTGNSAEVLQFYQLSFMRNFLGKTTILKEETHRQLVDSDIARYEWHGFPECIPWNVSDKITRQIMHKVTVKNTVTTTVKDGLSAELGLTLAKIVNIGCKANVELSVTGSGERTDEVSRTYTTDVFICTELSHKVYITRTELVKSQSVDVIVMWAYNCASNPEHRQTIHRTCKYSDIVSSGIGYSGREDIIIPKVLANCRRCVPH